MNTLMFLGMFLQRGWAGAPEKERGSSKHIPTFMQGHAFIFYIRTKNTKAQPSH